MQKLLSLSICAILIGSPKTGVSEVSETAPEFGKASIENIPSWQGSIQAIRTSVSFKRNNGYFSYTVNLNSIYVPTTGFAWTGGVLYEAHVVALEDRILGFLYESGGNERLLVSDSTNRYEANLGDTSTVVQTELERYKAGRGRYSGDPCYYMRIEELLGPSVMRDKRGPKIDGWPDTNAFSLVTQPSKLQGITVEGTNAVIAIEFGTNILARIAFDKNIRPVWATTNGVSIGVIPTNTVRHIEVKPDGQRTITVVF